MAQETVRLAEFGAGLRYEQVPHEVLQRAKDCIADTVAATIFGNSLPWSKIVIEYARNAGPGGKSLILGSGGPGLQPGMAALANGALAHGFELDNVTQPGSGVHTGAAGLPAALAVAQDRGKSGRELLTAIVAAAEVVIRIGWATKHTNEKRGFHAPGTTGPFGGAVAAGRMFGLESEGIANALGIAGSLSCGLMEFARSGNGAMVKRLHVGRAAESGVLAASLAHAGFTGPNTVLEGKAGFLQVFCTDFDLAALTAGLGTEWATLAICIKRYPCHITSQQSVQALQELRAEHGFDAAQVDSIIITGAERMTRANNIPEPTDVMMAQYSAPFCAALSLYRNPVDPASFNSESLADPAIRALCRRVTLMATKGYEHRSDAPTTVAVTLKDGRVLERTVVHFSGSPGAPLSREQMRDRFVVLAQSQRNAGEIFDRIQNLENEPDVDWLGAVAAASS